MFLLLWACSCGTPVEDTKPAPVDPRVGTPARLVVPHDPVAAARWPKCLASSDAVCEVCGDGSDACKGIRKVHDLCAQRDTCNEQACADGERRLRAEPGGPDSTLCTE